jgi:hypothetical protein
LLQTVEREFADHAVGKARLSRAQFEELSSLARRLEYRMSGSLASIRAHLSGRDTIAFFDAWLEIEGLKGHRDNLQRSAGNLSVEVSKRNFDAYLGGIAERLAVYISPEIRRSVRWARYHINKAALDVRDGDFEGCRSHLIRSVDHLDASLKALRSWGESLSERERRFIPQF